MKKITTIIICCYAFTADAQNIGIGNTNPQAKLDVSGDIRLRSTVLTLPAGLNNNVDINTVKSGVYTFAGGAVNGCQITGFTAGVDGRFVTLFNNSTTAAIQLYDESNTTNPSAAANRILTGTGNTAVVFQNGSITLRYDGTKQRWTVTGSNYTDGLSTGGGSGGWGLTGNAGTNAASFIGTTDNKPLVIKTNNTEAVNIGSSGNVGIGITPGASAKLSIKGADDGILLYDVAGSYYGKAGNSAGSFLLEADADLIIKSATGSPMINRPYKNIILNPPSASNLTSVGNVGISTNTPTHKLSITQNFIESNNNSHVLALSGRNPLMAFNGESNNAMAYVKAVTDISQTPQYPIGGLELGSIPGAYLYLSTGYYPRLTVTDGGNVGIGTVNPKARLTIIKNTNELSPEGSLSIYGTTYSSHFHYSATEDTYIRGGKAGSKVYINDANIGDVIIAANGGNVGIGTSMPTYKLSVNGNIRSKEVVVESNWADYVFEADYKLPNLDSVELHIKENKHLPGIPNAETIKKDGLSVGVLQTKMMEKIEELTLYVIALKKEVDLLKNKVAAKN